jgi:hypothetical protein
MKSIGLILNLEFGGGGDWGWRMLQKINNKV